MDEQEEGARLAHTSLTKSFRGGIEGESTAEMLMARAAREDSTACVSSRL